MICFVFDRLSHRQEAEFHWIRANQPSEAVHMYTDAGLWDKAYKIASTYMKQVRI